jgi:putative transcriptional regulator
MKKSKNRILQGAKEALAFASGNADPTRYRVHVPPTIDVRAVRRRMGLTQAAFARRFGLPLSSVRDWEQGRHSPEGVARAYLKVIDRAPKAVEKALTGR